MAKHIQYDYPLENKRPAGQIFDMVSDIHSYWRGGGGHEDFMIVTISHYISCGDEVTVSFLFPPSLES